MNPGNLNIAGVPGGASLFSIRAVWVLGFCICEPNFKTLGEHLHGGAPPGDQFIPNLALHG